MSRSPAAILYDSTGTPLAVADDAAIPVGTKSLLVAGDDGTGTAHVVKTDTDGILETKITDGTDTVGISTVSGQKALKVDVVQSTGGGSGTSQADKSTFTEGTTQFTPIGGTFNETPASDPTEDQAAAARITAKRAIHVNLRNNTGTEIATSGNPIRVDPTGTTTQPVSDGGGSLTIDGTVTSNIGTTGGLALDATLTGGTQKAIVRGGAKGATVAADVTSTSEGADHQALDVQIYHGGTAKDPTQIRTLVNTDTVSAELTKWIGSTAPTVGQKTSVNSLPVVVASDQSAIAVSATSLPLPTGAATLTEQQTQTTSLQLIDDIPHAMNAAFSKSVPASGQLDDVATTDATENNIAPVRITTKRAFHVNLQTDTGTEIGTSSSPVRVDPTGTTAQPVTDNGGSLTVDGTITANIGTTGGLALDATLTGGTQKAIVRGGTKGATTPADVTSTAEGTDHQSLDVQIYHGGTAIDPTQIRTLTNADTVSAEITKWLGSTAPTVGQKTSTNSLPVVIASDQSAVAISAASLPLPTGAATLAEQQTQTTSLQLIDDLPHAMNAAFSKGVAAGGQLDDVATTAATEDNIAPVRITAQRAFHTNLRNVSGTEIATASNPVRIDPTGTTAQPVTDNAGSLTVDAPVGTPVAVRLSDGGAFYDSTKTGQLPSALVGGRLDTNIGAWLGSTVPTVGQKTIANSIPTVIASDQTAIPVSGTVTANQGSAAAVGGAWPVRVTDLTNTMPTMDVASRAGFVKLTNGTLTATVVDVGRIVPAPESAASTTSGTASGDITLAAVTTSAVRRTAYTEQTTNAQRSMASSSASDTSAGTGARTVRITYYDATGAGPSTETITLNGTSNVNTVSTTICFIESLVVLTAGSGGVNAGTITLFAATAGGGGAVGTIAVGNNRTFWSHHYVATGKTCNIINVVAAENVNNNPGLFELRSKAIGVANAAEILVGDLLLASISTIVRPFPVPITVTGPARIFSYVTTPNNTSAVFRCSFDFYDQ